MSLMDDRTERAAGTGLGATETLQDFLASTGRLTPEERRRIVEQALVLIEQFYVHLPLKRAMHAVDPVQRLKLLQYRLGGMSERRFHDEMISVFSELRDLHTNYILPAPFQSKTAILPFRVEEFFENGQRGYIVTEIGRGLGDQHFTRGVKITHWNGIPMDRAVELNADRQAGSNPHARQARGVDTMTARYMGMSAAPDERWVVLNYTGLDGQERQTRLDWRVFEPTASPEGISPDAPEDPRSTALGIDIQTEVVRRARKLLFAPEAVETERRAALSRSRDADAPEMDEESQSTMPDVLQFRTVGGLQGDLGYLRIRTFNVDPDAFVAEIVRILELLPPNGIIVDVRGNGGGIIMSGERLLQLFTPRKIRPERLHFINTPRTLDLCTRLSWLEDWRESISQAVETGSAFSDGFPVFPGEAEDCNRIGQRYHGPAILLIDGLCYSTTDIFAAGWQDHSIGPILGTDGNTGAGGANVWTHSLLGQILSGGQSPIEPLPKGSSFRVAIRRTTRVGERSGDPVEDLGVVPDEIHRLTREDLLNQNADLIARAAAILSELPARSLEAEVQASSDGTLLVSAATAGISRLDAYLGGRPVLTLDVEDGSVSFEIPARSRGNLLELRGFDGGKLVTARRAEVW